MNDTPPSEKYAKLREKFDPLIEARHPLVDKLLFGSPLTAEEHQKLQSIEAALDMVEATRLVVEAERMSLAWCLRLAKGYRGTGRMVHAIEQHMKARGLKPE